MADTTEKKPGNFGVVIPKMDTVISREEVLKGEPAPKKIEPAEPPPAVAEEQRSDFLDTVRKHNEKRGMLSDDGVTPKPKQKAEEASEEPVVEEPKPELPTPRVPDEDDVPPTRKSKEESVGDLKRSLKSERARASQYETRTQELEEKLATYDGLQERLEEVTQLKARITDLEKYEKIFGVHSTPEFQAKKTAANGFVSEAKEIATAYGVTTEIVDHAVKLTGSQLTTFLSQNVKNGFAVMDIRQAVLKAQGALSEITAIEETPEQSQELLASMVKETQDKRKAESVKTIKARQESAWAAILNHYGTGDAAIPELREKPGDPEHMDLRNSILEAGATEYGKVIGALANLGLSDLPKPIAHSIASHYQLAPLAATLLVQKRDLEKQVVDLTKKVKDLNGYKRPALQSRGTAAPDTAEPKSTAQVAEHVFVGAMQKVQNQQRT